MSHKPIGGNRLANEIMMGTAFDPNVDLRIRLYTWVLHEMETARGILHNDSAVCHGNTIHGRVDSSNFLVDRADDFEVTRVGKLGALSTHTWLSLVGIRLKQPCAWSVTPQVWLVPAQIGSNAPSSWSNPLHLVTLALFEYDVLPLVRFAPAQTIIRYASQLNNRRQGFAAKPNQHRMQTRWFCNRAEQLIEFLPQ